MTVPLYSYDSAFQGLILERTALRMERDGQAKVVRHPKNGRIARVIRRKLPGQPKATTIHDYVGSRYAFRHHIGNGHKPWALKPLAGRVVRGDESHELHLAPESLRPIFLRVLTDCLVERSA